MSHELELLVTCPGLRRRPTFISVWHECHDVSVLQCRTDAQPACMESGCSRGPHPRGFEQPWRPAPAAAQKQLRRLIQDQECGTLAIHGTDMFSRSMDEQIALKRSSCYNQSHCIVIGTGMSASLCELNVMCMSMAVCVLASVAPISSMLHV